VSDPFWIGVGLGVSVFPVLIVLMLVCFVSFWRVVK
jgi:hypothetical protein